MLAANVVAGECRRSLSSGVVLQSGHTLAAMSLICKDGATPRRILVVSKVGCPLIPPVSYSSSTIDVSHKGIVRAYLVLRSGCDDISAVGLSRSSSWTTGSNETE